MWKDMATLFTVSLNWLNVMLMFCSMFHCNPSNVPVEPANQQASLKNPVGYLNPELYREGIASLVHAKEQAEEMMYRNDVIAQLVTEMPYHDIQNRLLIAGNHKEENRSFFSKLENNIGKSSWNCGHRFDIFKLLNMVQRSREMNMERDEAIRDGTWTKVEQCTSPAEKNLEMTGTIATINESIGPKTSESIILPLETISTTTLRTPPFSLRTLPATKPSTLTENSPNHTESPTGSETCSQASDENESTSDTSETTVDTSTCREEDAVTDVDVVRRMMLAEAMPVQRPHGGQQTNRISMDGIAPKYYNNRENHMNLYSVTNQGTYTPRNRITPKIPAEGVKTYPNPVDKMSYQIGSDSSKVMAPIQPPLNLIQSQGAPTRPSRISSKQIDRIAAYKFATHQRNKLDHHFNQIAPIQGIQVAQQFKGIAPYQQANQWNQTRDIIPNGSDQVTQIDKIAPKLIDLTAQPSSRVATNDLYKKSHLMGLFAARQVDPIANSTPPQKFQREESSKQRIELASTIPVQSYCQVQEVKPSGMSKSSPPLQQLFRLKKPFNPRIVSLRDKP